MRERERSARAFGALRPKSGSRSAGSALRGCDRSFPILRRQRLQIGDHIVDLSRIEPELGHGGMSRRDALRQGFGQRLHRIAGVESPNGGAIGRGLSPTRPVAWQPEQCTWTKFRPRCTQPSCAAAGSRRTTAARRATGHGASIKPVPCGARAPGRQLRDLERVQIAVVVPDRDVLVELEPVGPSR